jgi:hypothetical protein
MAGAITEIDSDQWTWEWDTAASVHITPYKQLLQNVQKDNTEILGIGGILAKSELRGDIVLQQGSSRLILNNVYYVPSTPRNLLPGSLMKKKNIHLRTNAFPEKVQQNEQTILIAKNSNGKSIIRSDQKLCMVAELSREIIAQDYHQKYGHIPLQAFKHIQEAPQWLHTYKMKECEACIQGKFRKPDSPTQPKKQRQIMSIAFSDVQEMSTIAYNGEKYNCISVEGATGFITNTTTIKTKSAASDAVVNMIQWMENATGKKLQSLKTDHGGEYPSHKFLQQLKERGIQLVENVPYHSETNPVAKRENLTVSKMARTAHLHSKAPQKY